MEDLNLYTHPKIYYNEATLAAGAVVLLDQEAYKLSKPMLVDYLWISGEHITVNGIAPPGAIAIGTDATVGGYLTGKWWVTTRLEATRRPVALPLYHNFAESKRWNRNVYTNVAVVEQLPRQFKWKFLRPWRLPANGGVILDVSNVMGAILGAVGFAGMSVVFCGIGVESKHRRTFEVLFPAGFVAPNSWTESEFVMNQTREAYDIDTLYIRGPNDVGGGVMNDIRQWNVMRLVIRPTIGEPFSEVPVPIAAYGIDHGPVTGYIYQPSGGPLMIDAGSTIGWEITNISAVNVRFQTALVGRVIPSGF